MSAVEEPREGSKLEQDDDMCCKNCGIGLGYYPTQVHGYERCPECEIEHVKKDLVAVFGTTSTKNAAFCWDTRAENTGKSDTEER